LVREATTPAIRSLFEHDGDIVLATFTVVEASSAIWRRWREKPNDSDRDAALGGLAQLCDAALKVDDMATVVRRARELFAHHALKGADALQLASVLVAADALDPIPFVTLDGNLTKAARAEGLNVINVNEDPAS
jgi:predicted nucleic acid-binding protein